MRLLSLDIAEFRRLQRRSFAMAPEWNLLIGANDAGKTSVLEALAKALQPLAGARSETRAEPPTQDEALRAQVAVEWNGTEYLWRLGEAAPDTAGERPPGRDALRQHLQAAAQARSDLPVFAFYRALPPPALDSVVAPLQAWIDASPATREGVQRRAIEQVLSTAVFAPDPVRLVAEGGRLGVSLDGGTPRDMASHGAGVRRLVAIAGDLAYRCGMLNPHLGAEASLRTQGIVLIDDIELHLHPNRQRSVVEDLGQAFPAIQFIAASHSPFIVQSIHAGQVIDLDGRDSSEAPDLSIEDIAESLMGVRIPQRSKRYLAMNAASKKAAALIQSAEGASEDERRRIRDELNRLSMPFSNNQAFHAFLSMERLEAGLMEDDA